SNSNKPAPRGRTWSLGLVPEHTGEPDEPECEGDRDHAQRKVLKLGQKPGHRATLTPPAPPNTPNNLRRESSIDDPRYHLFRRTRRKQRLYRPPSTVVRTSTRGGGTPP